MNIRRTGWSCAAAAQKNSAHTTNTTCTKEIVYFNPGNFSRVITSFSCVCLQRVYATIQFNKIDNSALSASSVASPSHLCRARYLMILAHSHRATQITARIQISKKINKIRNVCECALFYLSHLCARDREMRCTVLCTQCSIYIAPHSTIYIVVG